MERNPSCTNLSILNNINVTRIFQWNAKLVNNFLFSDLLNVLNQFVNFTCSMWNLSFVVTSCPLHSHKNSQKLAFFCFIIFICWLSNTSSSQLIAFFWYWISVEGLLVFQNSMIAHCWKYIHKYSLWASISKLQQFSPRNFPSTKVKGQMLKNMSDFWVYLYCHLLVTFYTKALFRERVVFNTLFPPEYDIPW